MSASPIDTLLHIAVPSKPSEPPERNEGAGAFRPALERAYGPEPSRAPAAPADEEEALEAESSASAAYDAADERAEEADEVVESPIASEDEHEGDDEAVTADAVEISEQAVSVAAADQPNVVDEAIVDAVQQAAALDGENLVVVPENAEGQQPSPNDGVGKESAEQRGTAVLLAEKQSAAGSAPDKVTDDGSLVKRKTASKETAAIGNSTKTGVESKTASEEGGNQDLNSAASTDEGLSEKAEVPVANDAPASEEQNPETTEPPRSRTAREDRLEPVKAPPVRQDAVTPSMESSAAPTEDSASLESSGAEGLSRPVGARTDAPPVPRAPATLDRLAARALRPADNGSQPGDGAAIDRPRFVQRVEGAVRAAHQRDGRVQVRLSPPELGTLRIELVVQNGVMTAKLEAETSAARNALLDNLPALRDRLAQQEIRVEKFDVDIRRDAGGSGGHGGTHDRNADQPDWSRQEGRGKPAAARPTTPPAAAPRTIAANAVSDAGLDVRI